MNIKPDDRIHISEKEIKSLKNIRQRISYKPLGVWYAFGYDWKEYIYDELEEDTDELYFYKVDVSNCNILSIDKKYKIHEITNTYGDDEGNLIDWFNISEKYDGVEFSPYFAELADVYDWYQSVSIASGCIWNTSKIRLQRIV